MIEQGKSKHHDLRMQSRKQLDISGVSNVETLTVKNFCFRPSWAISPFADNIYISKTSA